MTKAVHFRVETDTPEFIVRLEGESIPFDANNECTLELPENEDFTIAYDLKKAKPGEFFRLHVSQNSAPLEVNVVTDSGICFGFTGFET